MKDQKDTASSSEKARHNSAMADKAPGNGDSESMTSRAYARIRTDILSGALEPGRKLKIEELRKLYDLGTGPVRESLSLLTSDLLVERIDQRGFRVSNASIEEFDELLKTRCWLEGRALRESIRNGDSEWEERIALAASRLSIEPRSAEGDHFAANAKWEKLHKHFHMTLISACGSAFLLQFCNLLYDYNVRYRHLSRVTACAERDDSFEHEAIANATLARNVDLARGLLFAHYTLTGDLLKSAFHPDQKPSESVALPLKRLFSRLANY